MRAALLIAASTALTWSASTAAKVDAAAASRLNNELTPVGAERPAQGLAGIPEWKPAARRGGLADYPSDPALAGQKPELTLTKELVRDYQNRLTEGHLALFSKYPDSYKINVYPTVRDVTFPDPILEATAANALTATLPNADLPLGARLGFPFPIPGSGAEVLWNHKLRWRGDSTRAHRDRLVVQPDGAFAAIRITEEAVHSYANAGNSKALTGPFEFTRWLAEITAPPRLAGTVLMINDKSGTNGRMAWLVSPKARTPRPNTGACCDKPFEGADGAQTYDQIDLFNGELRNYNVQLVGKKEMYMPYHAYKLAAKTTKYKDLVRAGHLNQDLARYEVHRVWLVDAFLRAGSPHSCKMRRFYVDEDSWMILAAECYDSHDELLYFQEGHLVFSHGALVPYYAPEIVYNLQTGRYLITAFNESGAPDFGAAIPAEQLSNDALRKRAAR